MLCHNRPGFLRQRAGVFYVFRLHSHIHVHIHTYTYTYTYTYIYTYTYTVLQPSLFLLPTRRCLFRRSLFCFPSYAGVSAKADACFFFPFFSFKQVHAPTRAYTCSHTYHAHLCSRARTHTHTYTHTQGASSSSQQAPPHDK